MQIYKTEEVQKKIVKLQEITPDSWIDLENPTAIEIEQVSLQTGIDNNLMNKMLDEEELPRIEVSGDATLIVIDTPYLEDARSKNRYTTYPLGIIISRQNYIVTISLRPNKILDDFRANRVRDFHTAKKTRFSLQILLRTANHYLRVLNHVNTDIAEKEKILSKSTQNKYLIELLEIEKTLVYFITSLKANELVLEKLAKGNILDMYEEDRDLLEDAEIENKQAIEMSTIYRDILSSITDTYATIVSNNLNIAMKFLAGITIVFSIPTMIASFLGMNVPLGVLSKSDMAFVFIALFSFFLALVIAYWLKKKDML